MATVRTYNPSKVTVIINGHEVTGYADGSFLTVSQVADGITTMVGADGELARAINTDTRVDITLTLLQTSPTNDFLTSIYAADAISCGGVIGPIEVADLCGTTMFAASNTWVTKLADIEFAKEITNRAWTLQAANPSMHIVGSNAANN
jgi:hypothetical protein